MPSFEESSVPGVEYEPRSESGSKNESKNEHIALHIQFDSQGFDDGTQSFTVTAAKDLRAGETLPKLSATQAIFIIVIIVHVIIITT